jgi:hypothetical protein
MVLDRKCFYRTICRANNQAAGELVHGDPHAAIRGFRDALNWLRKGEHDDDVAMDRSCGGGGGARCEDRSCDSGARYDVDGGRHEFSVNDDDASPRDRPTPLSCCQTATTLLRLPFYSDDEQASPYNLFCYYNRTMVVLEDESDDSLLCMVILFNLAITCHHFGLTIPEGHEESLRKALALYKMVLAATQQQQQNGKNLTTNDAVVRLLLLATFSNMGHIYSHFMATYEEKVCQQQLNAVLIGTSLVLDAEEARKFLLNARQRPEWAPAA